MVLYVVAVLDVTVMRVLFFVLRVCMLRECDGAAMTILLVCMMDKVWLWLVQGL